MESHVGWTGVPVAFSLTGGLELCDNGARDICYLGAAQDCP